MIFLVNKQGKPMIFLTKEYCAKNIQYVVYHIKQDCNYPWVSLRIILSRPRNGRQNVVIQAMDFVDSALPSERHIQLKKLTVAASLQLDVVSLRHQRKSHTSILNSL
jgi:hypothetical protein